MEKKKFSLSGAIIWLFGLLFALLVGGVFYGAMAYQLPGAQQADAVQVQSEHPDALLTLADMRLVSEQTAQQEVGGQRCAVTTRIYQARNGMKIEATSASPAAYIERLSLEGWTPLHQTGYVLAGMEAVFSLRVNERMLSAREGNRVYMLRAITDERTMYSLGAWASLE